MEYDYVGILWMSSQLRSLPDPGLKPGAQTFNRLAVRTPSKFFYQEVRHLLLVSCCFAIAACVNQTANGPISHAQISVKQARRSRADARTAIGYYLDAAHSALSSAKSSSNTSSADPQAIYNSACQEMAVLLQGNSALWNRPISAGGQIYRLHFTSGSRQTGIWNPSYFASLRTPQQLRRRFRLLACHRNGWGGTLVGVHKPAAWVALLPGCRR